MSDHDTNKKAPQKAAKSQTSASGTKSIPPQLNLQNTIGNQAILRLMRQESPQAAPSIQRDSHEHGLAAHRVRVFNVKEMKSSFNARSSSVMVVVR